MEDIYKEVRGLVVKGIELREKGKTPAEALEYFERAIGVLSELPEFHGKTELYLDIQNHVGLTYYHLKDYELAKDIWEEYRVLSKVLGLPSMEAVFLRQLSRYQLWEDNDIELTRAYGIATDAYAKAIESNRKDLTWFAHGLFNILNRQKLPHDVGKKDLLKVIFEQEVKAFKNEWRLASNTEKGVWFTGILIDWLAINNLLWILKPGLFFSLALSKALKLKRREEQIIDLFNRI